MIILAGAIIGALVLVVLSNGLLTVLEKSESLKDRFSGGFGAFVLAMLPAVIAATPSFVMLVSHSFGLYLAFDRDVPFIVAFALYPGLYLATPVYLYLLARFLTKVNTLDVESEPRKLAQSPGLYAFLFSIVNYFLIFGGCTAYVLGNG